MEQERALRPQVVLRLDYMVDAPQECFPPNILKHAGRNYRRVPGSDPMTGDLLVTSQEEAMGLVEVGEGANDIVCRDFWDAQLWSGTELYRWDGQ